MTVFLQWFNGVGGFLLGLGTLILGVIALLKYLGDRRKQKRIKEVGPVSAVRQARRLTVLGAIALLAISAATFAGRSLDLLKEPLNVQLTTQAWDAFQNGNYQQAILLADSCIAEFRGAAEIQQARLDSLKIPLPPTGKVTPKQKTEIASRGLVNDVATCFFIKGRSAERLKRIDDAKIAYRSAMQYAHARCWDPKGWFWSPAEAAKGRLQQLK